jgi:DNA (cytosine-5)-methyltransferase 1
VTAYSLELCAGAGGQAQGLESAGFAHAGLVEIDPAACNTLRLNRPHWSIHEADLTTFDARLYKGVQLVAGGFPCPPFSIAGKQLGSLDDRDLFPSGIRVIDEVRPNAFLIENVKGILAPRFLDYRAALDLQFKKLGYKSAWLLLNACDYGVPQLRPRVMIIGLKGGAMDEFTWPRRQKAASTVGNCLYDLMAERGWPGADAWRYNANTIAPTIVGGSKKHGGPDLGPTRARLAWANLGVDGLGLANEPPGFDFIGTPRLTVRMVARLQGFPDTWSIWGKKTAAYRQVGNAFPPPVAAAVAREILRAIAVKRPRGRVAKQVWQAALL